MKTFRLALILKILLLALILAGGCFFFFAYNSYLILALMLLLSVISLLDLVKYVDTTNRDLARFLVSIKYSDFSQSFGSKKRGASFEELSAAINEVMDEFCSEKPLFLFVFY